MAFYRKQGGSNVAPSVMRRRSGSAWANVQTIKRRSGGAWVVVWSSYTASMTGTGKYVNASAGTGTYSTSPLYVTASGGSGSYTYTWSVSAGWSINGQGTSSASFSRYCTSGVDYTGTATCVVSDGTSSVTLNHPIEILVGTPL